ncbi:MAG TPA: radical SAM protein [Polyangia bacterium]|jgi:radical SAM superfamily enzyme YgiQ (UPF0313 family)/pyruvate-formate lyase-activating enzyme
MTASRVLFVNPPVKLPRVFAHYPTFSNIGMLHNAAMAEQAGFDVGVVDGYYLRPRLNYRPLDREVYHLGVELDELAEAVAGRAADAIVLVVTMFSDLHRLEETYLAAAAAAARRSHPGAFIVAADCHVCGMNYFPYDPAELLARVPALDAVVLGEGDAKLCEVLRRGLAGAGLDGIPEVAHRAGGRPQRNPGAAAPTKPLDAIPYPAFHLLDMENYFSCLADAVRADLVHEYHAPGRFLPLLTSRGCVYACNFCTQQVLRHGWRGHSVPYLVDMIRTLRERYRVDRFFFLDNNINVEPTRFQELTRFLADEGIAWDALNGYRADGLTDEALALMKRAGNAKVTVSAESGDPEVLRGIVKKRLDLKAVVRVARTCQTLGLPSQVHYVIGLPGETRAQINNTLEFATMLHEELDSLPLVQHAIPFRETTLYRECDEKGWFDPHPDTVPLWELETRPILRTPEFTPAEVLRFKRNVRQLIDAVETTTVLDVAAGCNSSCRVCERDEAAPAAAPDPDELIATLRARRARGATMAIITGGEPTVQPELCERLAQEARAAGYTGVTLATNGRMCSYRRLAERLARAGVDRAVTSLHAAAPAIHDELTGGAGSWHQTVAGIRNLRALGVRVEATVRVTGPGLPQLRRTVDLLASLGVGTVHVRYPAPRGRVLADPALIVPYPVGLPAIAAALEGLTRPDVSIQGVPFCLLPAAIQGRAAPLPFFMAPGLRRLKAKQIDRCRSCTELLLCLGFWREELGRLYRQGDVEPALAPTEIA